jgi:hypothetical protein
MVGVGDVNEEVSRRRLQGGAGAVEEGETNREPAMMREVLLAVVLVALALVGGWIVGLRLVGR